MIIGTDINGDVLLVGEGSDPSLLPMEFNGVPIQIHVLTADQEAFYQAMDANRAGTHFDGAIVIAIPHPPLSIEQLGAVVQAQIDVAYNAAIGVITTAYPETEINSWPKQEAEARVWTANNAAATPLLTALATARGISVADLASRVIAKADAYVVVAGELIGRRQARQDAIAAAVVANDLAALQAVVW